jgi:hypothetical protein
MIGEIGRRQGKHRLAISLPVANFPDFTTEIAGLDSVFLPKRLDSDFTSLNYPTHMRKLAKMHSAKVIITTSQPSRDLFPALPSKIPIPPPVLTSPRALSPLHRQKVHIYRLAVDYNTGARIRFTHKNQRIRALLHKSTLL